MTDIVKRLRKGGPCIEAAGCDGGGPCKVMNVNSGCACAEAADEIERLRAALEPFAKAADRYDPDENDGIQEAWDWTPTIGMLRRARAALKEDRT